MAQVREGLLTVARPRAAHCNLLNIHGNVSVVQQLRGQALKTEASDLTGSENLGQVT